MMKRNPLKIYLPFAVNEIKRSLAYRASFYLFVLCSCFGAFISYFLWMAIYGSSDAAVLGGLTRNEMIVYVFMSYVTSQIVNVEISDYISDDVMEGTVAMTLIKPIDYRMSLIFRAFGNVFYRFMAPAVFVWIGLEIYKVNALGIGVTSIKDILLYLFSSTLSILIFLLFDFCFGMVAFVTTYMFGMAMAKSALLLFLSGQLIPISFFPEALQQIFMFLPFSSMIYTPVMVCLGKYSGSELAFVLGRQLVWVVVLYVLGTFLWQRITKRLIVLGG